MPQLENNFVQKRKFSNYGYNITNREHDKFSKILVLPGEDSPSQVVPPI
jgi:hypothetical protein